MSACSEKAAGGELIAVEELRGEFSLEPAGKGRHLLLFQMEGSVQAVLETSRLRLERNQCCLIRPGACRALSSTHPRAHLMSVSVESSFFVHMLLPLVCGNSLLLSFLTEEGNRLNQSYMLFTKGPEESLRALLGQMRRESLYKPAFYQAALECALGSLFVTLSRSCWTETTLSAQPESDRAVSVLSYIRRNCAQATLEGTARHFSYHPNTIALLVKKYTGQSFSHYLREVRMEKAKLLLQQTSLPVAEVAALVGYRHVTSFYRSFRERYGGTPGNSARS